MKRSWRIVSVCYVTQDILNSGAIVLARNLKLSDRVLQEKSPAVFLHMKLVRDRDRALTSC